MLDPRIGRLLLLVGWLAIGSSVARADLPPGKPFVVPRDRAEWDARRPMVLFDVEGNLGLSKPRRPSPWRFLPDGSSKPQPAGLIVERATHEPAGPYDPSQDPPKGIFAYPTGINAAGRIPLVILIAAPNQKGVDALSLGWDGRPAAVALARFGFAVLAFAQNSTEALPIESLRTALDTALARPEVDPARVAVFALGRTGLVALELMALDSRITCGVIAVEAVDAGFQATAFTNKQAYTWATHFEELAALCAPRPLCLMVGESLPMPPSARSVSRRLERAVKETYKVYGKEGTGLTFSMFGEFAGYDSVNTRLQWMAGLEHLDKHFRPQGPTPLPHAPEPEPTFDPADATVLNLTESGIAGWSPEMSGRDSTWTWRDGVVVCRPKANEYGWLRCPVEVDDFLLQVEWQVPARGNAGIFLRARPVDWFLPPTEENRLRVMTLGLTWPSRTGLELQTQADPGIANRYSTGSLYRHAAPSANPTHSPDQWNRSTVRARGPRVEVWNNGEQVLDADLNRSTDTLPNPPLKGYIGLQNHGAPADYRAIKLKRLPPESGGAQGAASRSPAVIPAGRASR